MTTKVDLEKLKVAAAMCANEQCSKFDKKAVHYLGSQSVYCSLRCKYDDPKFMTNNETYGD
jgi:hypothetical protein